MNLVNKDNLTNNENVPAFNTLQVILSPNAFSSPPIIHSTTQLSSMISMLEAELIPTQQPSNLSLSSSTVTAPSTIIMPSPPRANNQDVSTNTSQISIPQTISEEFNHQIDTLLFHHENQSVEQHYNIPNVDSDLLIAETAHTSLRVESPIFSSLKNGDTGFDIDTLMLNPKYDSSLLCDITNDSNTLLPDPARITFLNSSFFVASPA
ncbi:unnamed protein product [Vicia faba]|uniref:Uncharacterized protein n=1 Tax=Vicia faba TaxID=3906 RepID=A0AAV0ZG34_VICFA|nr:unnamed protein product [Vicia faba]